jgi:Flp pilus assembly protein TadD
MLGDIAMRAKDFRAASKLFERAAKLVPEHAEWHRKLADALKSAGDTSAADRELSILARLQSRESAEH